MMDRIAKSALVALLGRVSQNRRVIRVARLIGTLLTVISVLLVLRQGSVELASTDPVLLLQGLSVVLVAYGASFTIQALVWSMMMGALSQTRPSWRDLEIFAYSNLIRRTPGMIWYLIERVDAYRVGGLSGRVTLLASALEWLLLLAAALVVLAVTSIDVAASSLPALAVVGLVTAALLTASSLRRRARLDPPVSVAQPTPAWFSPMRASLPELALAAVAYTTCYFLGGSVIFTLAHAADPTSTLMLWGATSMWALTSVVGLASSVLIPANVGLREITVVALLLPHTALPAAVTVAAMMRVLFAVADVACSLALWRTAKWIGSLRTGHPDHVGDGTD